jgi:L-alanine-DL-glutamate epimerase-like enolase superfamily enzyme
MEIRRAIGSETCFRVDANQGCNLTEYLPTFRKMEAYNLEFIEQPLPVWDVDGYQKLCVALDTPILIDEGIYTPHDLIALIKRDAVDAVNIKILKTGLRGGKKIAAIAESAGLPCLVGSMFETGIGTAVGIHFAISTRNVSQASECMFPTLLAEDIVEDEPYSNAPDGCAWGVPQGVGLGVSLKPEIEMLL